MSLQMKFRGANNQLLKSFSVESLVLYRTAQKKVTCTSCISFPAWRENILSDFSDHNYGLN